MKNLTKDYPFLFCLSLAFFLLFVSYFYLSLFWYVYTPSMACLMALALYFERSFGQIRLKATFTYGLLSGIFMYIITWTASKALPAIFPPLQLQLESLYTLLSPTDAWQYSALILLIIPGEEIFWRGLIEKRLLSYSTKGQAILLSTLLYTLPLIFSGNLLLVLAGIGGGLLWGFLYAWRQSLSMVILSHLVFDLLLLAIFPLV